MILRNNGKMPEVPKTIYGQIEDFLKADAEKFATNSKPQKTMQPKEQDQMEMSKATNNIKVNQK